MASTRVDFPEPISPVSRMLSPPGCRRLELVLLSPQAVQEAEFDDLVQVCIHAVEQARLIAGLRQEQAHLLGDLVAADHQARFATGGIELRQFLAQQDQDQADRITELTARDQARQFGFAGRRYAMAQIGVAFGVVEDQLEAERGAVIAHASLQVDQRLPQCGVAFAIQHALEEADQQLAQAILVVHGRFGIHTL